MGLLAAYVAQPPLERVRQTTPTTFKAPSEDSITAESTAREHTLTFASDRVSVPTRVIVSVTTTPTPTPNTTIAMNNLAATLLSELQSGHIDHSRFNSIANSALTAEHLSIASQQLGPLGPPKRIEFISRTPGSLPAVYKYRIVWDSYALYESFQIDTKGKIAAFDFRPI